MFFFIKVIKKIKKQPIVLIIGKVQEILSLLNNPTHKNKLIKKDKNQGP
jgi:hypothetical protein